MSDFAPLSLALFFLAKLSLGGLLALGAIGGLAVIGWSYSYWRAAIKLALVVALLEGAIRKWGFPAGQELVYFLKDGFLLGAYLRLLLGNEPEFRQSSLRLPTTEILFLVVFLSFFSLHPNFGSPLQGLFGLKMYFMYLPLVFIMPRLFRNEAEMVRQLTWYLWIGLPICVLGFLQWRAGPDSPLNVYAWGDDKVGSVAGFGFGDKVRVTGTFSYIAGHTTFLLYFTGLSLVLMSERKTWKPWLIIGLLLPLLMGNVLMNGSRGLVLLLIFLIGVFAVFGFAGQIGMGTHFRSFLIAAGSIGSIAVIYLFVDALFYLSNRFQSASDNIQDRATTWHWRTLEHSFNEAGVGGYGLGITFPASGSLASALRLPPPRERPPLMESEPGQIWLETGPLGFFAWFSIRGMLLMACFTAYRKARTPLQRSLALLAILINLPYLLSQVVGNHTSNILIHSLTGLALVPLLESHVHSPRRASTLTLPGGRPARPPSPHAVGPSRSEPPPAG